VERCGAGRACCLCRYLSLIASPYLFAEALLEAQVANQRPSFPIPFSHSLSIIYHHPPHVVELGAILTMAPVNSHAVANAVSMQVLSHDETSILVEAGGFTPMRWFLERGAHHMQATDDDNESEHPPKKRAKLARSSNPRTRSVATSTAATIPLARVTIDIHFPETLAAMLPKPETIDQDVNFEDSDGIPVILYHINDYGQDVQMQLAHPTHEGAVLKADLSYVLPQVLEDLRMIASIDRQKASIEGTPTKDHPASVTRCLLKRSMGELYNVVRLEASVAWRNGASAFPAGVPVGKARVYPDYELKARFFPDSSRNEAEHSQSWTPQDFYDSVHVPDKKKQCGLGDVLESQLYPFQKRAVTWMLQREGVRVVEGHTVPISPADLRNLDTIRFQEVIDSDGNTCYVNHLQAMISRHRPEPSTYRMSGGLLAEEMGLGKTVELMALISLHRRTQLPSGIIFDVMSGTDVLPSRATLIVTPTSILPQWRSELKRHAPDLRVMHYEGIPPPTKKHDEKKTLEDLTTNYDVILTTYQILAREVHFAEDPPARNMRRERKFDRKRSPLVQVQFWRAVMDEAQMIETSVTAAARVACRIPRVHSWAVSGTPLRKDVSDLHGLLIFLRFKPLDEDVRLWSHIVMNHRHIFRSVFGEIALRHTKTQIRDELHLPAQKRVVITMPFTAVEHQHYDNIFTEMCEELELQTDGSPKHGNWDPENTSTVEAMRRWLVRMRQTCLHPQVGGRNRKALGRGQGQAPLRTVAEVLEVMIDQNETATRIDERAAVQTQLQRAHVLGNNREDEKRSLKALEIYRSAMEKSSTMVDEARQRLENARADRNKLEDESATDDEESSNESTPLLGNLRTGLRISLELQHVCTFFAATACYQIKVNETLTQPESDDYQKLEAHEVELYERAKAIRREILRDASRKAEFLMKKMKDLESKGMHAKLPKIQDLKDLGGIENRRIIEKSDELFDVIREQSAVIVEWRAKMADSLMKPLVDEDEIGNEITGEEYEESTKQQDELYVFFDALKAIQADLNTFITGEDAALIDHEAKTLVKLAKRTLDPEDIDELLAPCHAPERLLALFEVRNNFRSRKEEVGSVRGLIREARALLDSMQWQGEHSRAGTESTILQQHIAALQTVFNNFTKALAGLEKDIDIFRSTQNQRLQFYRQLQEVSDAVAPYKEELDEQLDLPALGIMMAREEQQNTSLAQLRTKHRFLMHLRDETGAEGPRICVICQSSFENGVLTVCGHQYCKECIGHWWRAHRTCPVCKRGLALVDFHNITYKPQELRAKEEVSGSSSSPNDTHTTANESSPRQQSAIYSEVDNKLMNELKAIDLPASFGTKIDTLGRHLLWIREHDPGAKAIVFSQYRDFLDVLGRAFGTFKIGFSRLGRPGAVEKFRHDASVDCLLLDAKTDSSGLTLVNATHVFICEPLIQTAVELQAIARVHRIGQTRQTTVWMYLISDTVEESIYEISVARRLAHVQSREQDHRRNQKSRATTPAPIGDMAIEAADTEEMQSAPIQKLLSSGKTGGELVGQDDLWKCLFGKAGKVSARLDADADVEADLGRNLRGHAAEMRQLQQQQQQQQQQQ
jgi:E3 ubiquitin-protein ligase SHPRH